MHTDHDHHNDAMQFRVLVEPRTVGLLRDEWWLAAEDAVRLGVGRWVDHGRSSIYLKDEASIQRVHRK